MTARKPTAADLCIAADVLAAVKEAGRAGACLRAARYLGALAMKMQRQEAIREAGRKSLAIAALGGRGRAASRISRVYPPTR